jgi:hypothetical protein
MIVHNVIAVVITFSFVLALGATALVVINRWERHRRRPVRIARHPVIDGSTATPSPRRRRGPSA